MSRFWDRIFGLNYELSIWVEEEDLGKEKLVYHKNERYSVKIPQEIDKEITLRLRGLGKTRIHKAGDLLLHVWLNKGEDVRKSLWLSETSARNGADKKLFTGQETITMVVPPKSYNGELRPKNWTQKRRSLVNSFPSSLLSNPLVLELDRG